MDGSGAHGGSPSELGGSSGSLTPVLLVIRGICIRRRGYDGGGSGSDGGGG